MAMAKRSALICVEEMEQLHLFNLGNMVGWMGGYTHRKEIQDYYIELKNEIERL